MEREVREREGREGRGKKKGRGIIVGGIALLLVLLGCNNGAIEELEKKNKFYESIANLGKGFLSVFTDLGDMVTDVLGIKAETKKSEIKKYFNKIAETMESVKTKLQNELSKNGNYEKVKTVVDKFIKEKLDVIAGGAKEAASGAEGTQLLGDMADTATGGAVNVGEVDKLIKGIKTIVEAVELKEGKHDAGTDKKALDGSAARNGTDDVGNLFANNQAGSANTNTKKSAADAAKAVGAVTGADILKAISQGESGDAATLAKYDQANGNAANGKKDAIVAGGIALRAMAKGGKFAGQTDAQDAIDIVKGATVSAVNKTLSTLVIGIKNTVDNGLKKINEALASVNQGDMLPETSESRAAKK